MKRTSLAALILTPVLLTGCTGGGMDRDNPKRDGTLSPGAEPAGDGGPCAEGDARGDLKGVLISAPEGEETMMVVIKIENSSSATCDYEFDLEYTDSQGNARTLTQDMGSGGHDWNGVAPGELRRVEIRDVPTKDRMEDWKGPSGGVSPDHLLTFERRAHIG
ncbi:hypothetical protein ABT097_04840 [Streptomyces sp. NPDC002225]|uniref:hypothetical protein n=1 Tax=Streptomyces sp. NPDC002225 TaxID=3154413 RepID=UPI0033307998